MSTDLHAYTAEGLLTGSVAADDRLADLLANEDALIVERAVLTPFDGPADAPVDRASVDVDDLMIVVAPGDSLAPFHAAWHRLTLDVGPYRVRGELPALPGFDPSRALARPSGSFVMLGRVTVELRGAGLRARINEHPFVWVNRYSVDAVDSALELAFFFPGAHDPAARSAIA